MDTKYRASSSIHCNLFDRGRRGCRADCRPIRADREGQVTSPILYDGFYRDTSFIYGCFYASGGSSRWGADLKNSGANSQHMKMYWLYMFGKWVEFFVATEFWETL